MSGPIVGLDHVQVAAPAGCEEAARGFYGALLGLEEIPKPRALAGRGGVWFRLGAQELHVGVSDPFEPAVKAHPALRAVTRETLVQLVARLEQHGVEISWPDAEEIPGFLRCYVHDPWGNRIELLA
jgi:catechol 2,3-dioxygenase-like lactoylglutathione lyase family enzyme